MIYKKVAVRSQKEIMFIPLAEITFIRSKGEYCEVHTVSKSQYEHRANIEALENQEEEHMLRVSHTVVINTMHLACIHSENGWFNTAEMDDCNEFEIDQDRVQSVLQYEESLMLEHKSKNMRAVG